MAATPSVTAPGETHPWVRAAQQDVHFGVMGGPMDGLAPTARLRGGGGGAGVDSYWTFDHPLGNPDWATTLAAWR